MVFIFGVAPDEVADEFIVEECLDENVLEDTLRGDDEFRYSFDGRYVHIKYIIMNASK